MFDDYPERHEFASPNELDRILSMGSDWLIANGRYNDENGRVLDEHEGLPVATEQPHYDFEIDMDTLAKNLPEAITIFEPSGPLRIAYWVPVYEFGDEINGLDFMYIRPALTVVVPKNEDSELAEEMLLISRDEDGRISTSRMPTYRHELKPRSVEEELERFKSASEGDFAEKIARIVQGWAFSDEMGLSKINLDELGAIEDIVKFISAQ